MEQLAQAVTESTDAGVQLNMDCQEVMAKIKLATESVTMALVEGGSQRHAGKEGTSKGVEEEAKNMYADSVRGHPLKLIPIMKSNTPAPAFYIPPHCRRIQEESRYIQVTRTT